MDKVFEFFSEMAKRDPVTLLLLILFAIVLVWLGGLVVAWYGIKWRMKRDERADALLKTETDAQDAERRKQYDLLETAIKLIATFSEEMRNNSAGVKQIAEVMSRAQDLETERIKVREKTLGEQTNALRENTNVLDKLSEHLPEIPGVVEKHVALIDIKIDAAIKEAPEILRDAFYALLEEKVLPVIRELEKKVLSDLLLHENLDALYAKNQRDWDVTLGRIDQKFNEIIKAQANLGEVKTFVNNLSEKMRELIETMSRFDIDKSKLPALDPIMDTPIAKISVAPEDLIYFADRAKRSHAMVIEAILDHIDSLLQPEIIQKFQAEYDAAEHDEKRIQVCQVWLMRDELAEPAGELPAPIDEASDVAADK